MNKYRFFWSNSHQLFYMMGSIDAYRKYPDIPFNRADAFQVSEGNLMTCYLAEQDMDRHVAEGAMLLDRAQAGQYLDAALEQCQRHRAFFAKLKAEDLDALSNEELLAYWRGLIDHYAHSLGYFRSTQEEPSRQIVSTVTDVVTPEEAADLLVSTELDEINKEEVDWETIVRTGFTKEKALAHIAKYPWLFQNSLSYDETVEELKQRLEGHVTRDIKQEKQELKERQAKLLEKYPAAGAHIDTLHRLAVLRPEVKACWAATGYYAAPLLQTVAARFGVDLWTLAFVYRSEDTEALLAEERVLSDQEVADRKLCTAYELVDGVLTSLVGQEALDLKEQLLGSASGDEVTELRGSTARPGKVTGVVKVLKINDPEATKAFRQSFTEGILVTSMTQPNVVDIARRASAIITDEGGMLCHAAIISREFGIPCIVGTHTASQDLRDGDLVEVDAERGIVTILERVREATADEAAPNAASQTESSTKV